MDADTSASLAEYAGLLFDANRETNLVSRRLSLDDVRQLVEMYSRTLTACEVPAQGWLLDVGSGGGLPGIPIAIAHPDIDVTLNESRRLRIEALETIVDALALENCDVLAGRIETFDLDNLDVRPNIISAFGVGKALAMIPLVAAIVGDAGVGLVSIPAEPTSADRAQWLLAAALQDCSVDVLERVLGGERSVLRLRCGPSDG